ncbi:hypothetical protein MK280_17065, partial [Myxococcota bacterium]|nr:hypothetical protein [Myxococcota bacterium]
SQCLNPAEPSVCYPVYAGSLFTLTLAGESLPTADFLGSGGAVVPGNRWGWDPSIGSGIPNLDYVDHGGARAAAIPCENHDGCIAGMPLSCLCSDDGPTILRRLGITLWNVFMGTDRRDPWARSYR